jgi:hypothetical protein
MILRRGLLSGGGAMVIASSVRGIAMTTRSPLRFDVLRNGHPVGHHSVTFQTEGSALMVNIQVNIKVGFGPLVFFRYEHSAREVWHGDEFVSIDSETNDNGKPCRVHAVRAKNGVIVESANAPRAVFGANAIPLTHWNVLCMEQPLFNPQDGVAINSKVMVRGDDTVALGDERTIRAKHYSLVGKVALDDWYDPAQRWVALHSIGTDGSTIDYRLVV